MNTANPAARFPTFPPSHVPPPVAFPVASHRLGDTFDEEIAILATQVHQCVPRGIVMAALYDFMRKHPITQHFIIAECEAFTGVQLFVHTSENADAEAVYNRKMRRLLEAGEAYTDLH